MGFFCSIFRGEKGGEEGANGTAFVISNRLNPNTAL